MRSTVRRAVCAVVMVAGVLGSGCGGDDDAGGEKTPVSLVEGVTVEVRVLDNRYVPGQVTVKPGTQVVFVNDGRNDHNVTPAEDPAGGGFDYTIKTEDLLVGKKATRRFTEPGTFVFYCTIHGTAKAGMTGKVIVEG